MAKSAKKRKKRPTKPRSRRPPAKAPKPAKKQARRTSWQVQEARANLSTVVDAAMAGRPQEITRAGEEAVVVVSAKDYKTLIKLTQSLDELFGNSPLAKLFGKDIPEFRHKELLRNVFI